MFKGYRLFFMLFLIIFYNLMGVDTPIELPIDIPVESFELPETITLKVGETITLDGILPKDATNKIVDWDSSDENVAIIDNAKLTALSSGITIVFGITYDGAKDSECKIIVENKDITLNIRIDMSSKLIKTGEIVYFHATWSDKKNIDVEYKNDYQLEFKTLSLDKLNGVPLTDKDNDKIYTATIKLVNPITDGKLNVLYRIKGNGRDEWELGSDRGTDAGGIDIDYDTAWNKKKDVLTFHFKTTHWIYVKKGIRLSYLDNGEGTGILLKLAEVNTSPSDPWYEVAVIVEDSSKPITFTTSSWELNGAKEDILVLYDEAYTIINGEEVGYYGKDNWVVYPNDNIPKKVEDIKSNNFIIDGSQSLNNKFYHAGDNFPTGHIWYRLYAIDSGKEWNDKRLYSPSEGIFGTNPDLGAYIVINPINPITNGEFNLIENKVNISVDARVVNANSSEKLIKKMKMKIIKKDDYTKTYTLEFNNSNRKTEIRDGKEWYNFTAEIDIQDLRDSLNEGKRIVEDYFDIIYTAENKDKSATTGVYNVKLEEGIVDLVCEIVNPAEDNSVFPTYEDDSSFYVIEVRAKSEEEEYPIIKMKIELREYNENINIIKDVLYQDEVGVVKIKKIKEYYYYKFLIKKEEIKKLENNGIKIKEFDIKAYADNEFIQDDDEKKNIQVMDLPPKIEKIKIINLSKKELLNGMYKQGVNFEVEQNKLVFNQDVMKNLSEVEYILESTSNIYEYQEEFEDSPQHLTFDSNYIESYGYKAKPGDELEIIVTYVDQNITGNIIEGDFDELGVFEKNVDYKIEDIINLNTNNVTGKRYEVTWTGKIYDNIQEDDNSIPVNITFELVDDLGYKLSDKVGSIDAVLIDTTLPSIFQNKGEEVNITNKPFYIKYSTSDSDVIAYKFEYKYDYEKSDLDSDPADGYHKGDKKEIEYRYYYNREYFDLEKGELININIDKRFSLRNLDGHDDDGEYKFKIYPVDQAGNIGVEISLEEIYVDTIAPRLEKVTKGNRTLDYIEKVHDSNQNLWAGLNVGILNNKKVKFRDELAIRYVVKDYHVSDIKKSYEGLVDEDTYYAVSTSSSIFVNKMSDNLDYLKMSEIMNSMTQQSKEKIEEKYFYTKRPNYSDVVKGIGVTYLFDIKNNSSLPDKIGEREIVIYDNDNNGEYYDVEEEMYLKRTNYNDSKKDINYGGIGITEETTKDSVEIGFLATDLAGNKVFYDEVLELDNDIPDSINVELLPIKFEGEYFTKIEDYNNMPGVIKFSNGGIDKNSFIVNLVLTDKLKNTVDDIYILSIFEKYKSNIYNYENKIKSFKEKTEVSTDELMIQSLLDDTGKFGNNIDSFSDSKILDAMPNNLNILRVLSVDDAGNTKIPSWVNPDNRPSVDDISIGEIFIDTNINDLGSNKLEFLGDPEIENGMNNYIIPLDFFQVEEFSGLQLCLFESMVDSSGKYTIVPGIESEKKGYKLPNPQEWLNIDETRDPVTILVPSAGTLQQDLTFSIPRDSELAGGKATITLRLMDKVGNTDGVVTIDILVPKHNIMLESRYQNRKDQNRAQRTVINVVGENDFTIEALEEGGTKY